LEIVGIALISKAHGLVCQTPKPTTWLIVAVERGNVDLHTKKSFGGDLMPMLAAVALPKELQSRTLPVWKDLF
jgi:hypothetical protein